MKILSTPMYRHSSQKSPENFDPAHLGEGTEVQFKSCMPGYYSMRDLNEDPNGCNNWPLHYRERHLPNGQIYNCSLASATADSCFDYDKDAVKQKILEHEAIFKKQVYELHRLYRIQKDLMDEIRRKELSSSPLASRCFLSDDARKLQSPGFVSNCGRPSISDYEASYSPMKSLTGHNSPHSSSFPLQNGCTSKVPEWLDSRPSKVRRRMFDLTLPAERYIDPEESEPFKGDPNDRDRKAVVDLNQPIFIEDTDMSVHPRGHSLYDDEKILGKELSCSSQCRSSNGTLSNHRTEINRGGRGWIAHVVDAGHDCGDLKHALQSKNKESPIHLPGYTANQHKVSFKSDWGKSNLHPLSPWERPSGSLTRKSISYEGGPHPDLSSVQHSNFQSQRLGHGMVGERCQQSGGGPDAGLRMKSAFDRNGFFSMSSSPGHEGISSWCDNKSSVDIKPSAAMDLNRVLSDRGESQEDHVAVLPWLEVNSSPKDKASAKTASDFEEKTLLQSPNNQLTSRTEVDEYSSNTKLLGVPISRDTPMQNKESSSITGKSGLEVAGGGKNMRMLDINLPCDQVPELSNSVPEDLMVLENKEPNSKISGLNCQIDLNSCADEGETIVLTTDGATGRKISVIIDLEATPCPEMEEEISSEDEKHIQPSHREIECIPDETIKIAAEAIVAISSVPDLPKPSSAENLEWFASIVLKERQVRDFRSSLQGIDYFESMTLKLTEMKDEEHLPHPLVPPEILKLREEDSATVPSAASRRPQRKGRQRRDFQRDILPGLASLSRHEVMEDIQMFGGLMKATGHTWTCGPTRHGSARNRLARPRRRRKATGCLSPPPPIVPTQAFPPVNLTGWGKATRPRRQRYPASAGNPSSIQLT